MWVLIKKEFREHRVFLFLGFIVSLISCFPFLSVPESLRFSNFANGWHSNSIPLAIANRGYLVVLCWVMLGFSFLYGLLLSGKEELKKTWDFLLHRPLSRSLILRSKLIAGVLMIVSSLGIPLLLFIFWNTIPGNYPAPWNSLYLYGIITIFGASILVFLSAFLLGIWDVSWLGVRFIPLVSTAFFITAVFKLATKESLFVFVFLAFALHLKAIWEVFLSNEKLKPALSFLILIALMILAVFTVSIVEELSSHSYNPADNRQYGVGFSDEGKPIQYEHSLLFIEKAKIKTLDGKIIQQGPKAFQNFLQDFKLRKKDLNSPLNLPSNERVPIKVFRMEDNSLKTPLIYYNFQENYFSLYDWKTALPFRYIGKNGFFKKKESIEPFTGKLFVQDGRYKNLSSSSHEFYITTEEGIFLADFKKEKVTQIHKGKAFDWIAFTLTRKKEKNNSSWPENFYGVWTGDSIDFYHSDWTPFKEFSLPEILKKPKDLKVTLLKNQQLGITFEEEIKNFTKPIQEERKVSLFKIDSQGKILWKGLTTIPLNYYSVVTIHFYPLPVFPGFNFYSLFTPLILAYLEDRHSSGIWLENLKSTNILWFLIIKGFICMGLGFLLLRKRNISKWQKRGWLIYFFLGEFIALLTVWLLLFRDKKIPCVHCQTKISPALETCPQCHSKWPPSKPCDSDIFVSEKKKELQTNGS